MGSTDQEDMISYLPDSILQSILTMMPLKSAIRTDVLSKKWRNLWKYSLSTATALEFGEDLANNISAEDFVETVDRYLLMNDSKKLERFHVYFCPFELFASDIERWISFATGKGVRYLDIDLYHAFRKTRYGKFTDGRSSPFELPSSLFDCDSLIDLSISLCNFITPSNLINFGGLQSLSISHSNFSEEMLQSILTECCLLESLSLSNCLELVDIRIMVPDLKLKRLTIRDCCSIDLLEINAPKLQSFHYFGEIFIEINFLNISSLEDASIYSTTMQYDYMDFLLDLSHIQILTLCQSSLVLYLNRSDDYLAYHLRIKFQNLQELQLLMDKMTNEDFTFFHRLFYVLSFPFLEKLFIQLPKQFIYDPKDLKYGEHARLDDLTFDNLKLIKITNFKGSINELRLISFFLRKAPVLETLVLVIQPKWFPGDLRENMLLLPKASPIAQINLLEFGKDDDDDDDGLNPTHLEIYDEYKKKMS